MIKTKEFIRIQNSNYGSPNIDEIINQWLEENKNIEIMDMKYQVSTNLINEYISTIFASALIIYKED